MVAPADAEKKKLFLGTFPTPGQSDVGCGKSLQTDLRDLNAATGDNPGTIFYLIFWANPASWVNKNK